MDWSDGYLILNKHGISVVPVLTFSTFWISVVNVYPIMSQRNVRARILAYRKHKQEVRNNGGIDLRSDEALSVQNNGQVIKFHIDPAQLAELQNAPGFVPVIISIKPMTNLRAWLGGNDNQPVAMLKAL